jgi:hypothetical protein
MITLTVILVLAAIIVIIASAIGKAPLWVGTLLLALVVALNVIPLK